MNQPSRPCHGGRSIVLGVNRTEGARQAHADCPADHRRRCRRGLRERHGRPPINRRCEPPAAGTAAGEPVRPHGRQSMVPARAGTVLTYKGDDEGTPATDVFRVTGRTKPILGIRATVIDDRVYHRGRLAERTNDWYAQDRAGNVWYLGEKTATLKADGTVESTEGSWRAGVDGARAGIFMPAQPRVHAGGWQEYYKGHAQDRYEILGLTTKVRAPAAASNAAMLTQETTPLEPGVVDHKVYVRDVGTVTEETVKGGHERFRLVSIRRR